MAQKRMFSLKLMNSARFLKMPVDTQNLYFHLALRADDDGVVEAFSVMRLVGASEDNLRILHAKEFITILNDDFVAYINDWLEHNTIRADRKIDSIYQDLLIKMLPDVQLIEGAKCDKKKVATNRQPNDGKVATKRQPNDGLDLDLGLGLDLDLDLGLGKCVDLGTPTFLPTYYQQAIGQPIPIPFFEKCESYINDGMQEVVISQAILKGKGKDVPHKYIESVLEAWFQQKKFTLEDIKEKQKEEPELDYFQKVARGLIDV